MIYTDGSKIIADTHLELMAYAKEMKMSAWWFRDKGDWGYFEIFGNMRKLIMRDQARVKLITASELIIKSQAVYGSGSR